MDDRREIYIGNSQYLPNSEVVRGEFVNRNGEEFYKISNFLSMPPFFISVASDSDHWMYVSSYGGLTCGRRNPDFALFPYVTDDKIHDSSANTGPKTAILVKKNERIFLWEPFELKHKGIYNVSQNIYKNFQGNQLVFEEINYDLQASFSYRWMNSDKYGFIRESFLQNLDDKSTVEYTIWDGIRNILPYGINRGLQANMSTLVDGYKKCEVEEKSGLGIYTLSAIMTDKAEPSEALKATTVWQTGLLKPKILLSTDQWDRFTSGIPVSNENSLKGRRGAYFVSDEINLEPLSIKNWLIIAELNQGPCEVTDLTDKIEQLSLSDIYNDVNEGTDRLKLKVAAADGFQHTSDSMTNCRHYSNTLFNVMRGGIFSNEYTISKENLLQFINNWNKEVFAANQKFLISIPEQISYLQLLHMCRSVNDPHLERLIYEYLPLTFGRRHGDPSRPWNLFSIDIKNADGTENIYYQGNWRDIFQNWHALSLSYPEFIESIIAKFVNASTPDGYNPYRITNEGFDWEVPDPEDPWSNIGYWGDHQVIYLLNLLELSARYHPGLLEEFLTKRIFVYANVPYRIKSYEQLLADPRNSVEFDADLDNNIRSHITKIGSDARLCMLKDGTIVRANLTEKLLVSLLAKLVNFVPGGGIWMNTQRPEWNDANNALVGYGCSMVTLYQLYRSVNFVIGLFQNLNVNEISVSDEVADYFAIVNEIFETNAWLLNGKIDDRHRKTFMDLMGKAGDGYRLKVYSGYNGRLSHIQTEKIIEFLRLCRLYLYQTIKLNKRTDGLYHSYNLVHFQSDGYSIEYLYEMLEGQVALLSSGFLSPEEGVELLDALRQSKMFRPDQKSYMLYPDRQLPDFMEKNNIPLNEVMKSDFLMSELESKNKRFIEADKNGGIHFNGIFKNAAELKQAISSEPGLSNEEINKIANIYYELFDHKSFTGRSGTFYKYEGLGCIYWHMVSKLLLAVQEFWYMAEKINAKKSILDKIKAHYQHIKEGLGANKTPLEYGAFPTDPYSHTPGFAGAQQPGMTGQVKEDFISRFGELGVVVENGQIAFKNGLLNNNEFIEKPSEWSVTVKKENRQIILDKNSMAFMLCGVPVIYAISAIKGVEIEFNDGSKKTFDSYSIDRITSKLIFARSERILRILVNISD